MAPQAPSSHQPSNTLPADTPNAATVSTPSNKPPLAPKPTGLVDQSSSAYSQISSNISPDSNITPQEDVGDLIQFSLTPSHLLSSTQSPVSVTSATNVLNNMDITKTAVAGYPESIPFTKNVRPRPASDVITDTINLNSQPPLETRINELYKSRSPPAYTNNQPPALSGKSYIQQHILSDIEIPYDQ